MLAATYRIWTRQVVIELTKIRHWLWPIFLSYSLTNCFHSISNVSVIPLIWLSCLNENILVKSYTIIEIPHNRAIYTFWRVSKEIDWKPYRNHQSFVLMNTCHTVITQTGLLLLVCVNASITKPCCFHGFVN